MKKLHLFLVCVVVTAVVIGFFAGMVTGCATPEEIEAARKAREVRFINILNNYGFTEIVWNSDGTEMDCPSSNSMRMEAQGFQAKNSLGKEVKGTLCCVQRYQPGGCTVFF